MSFLQSIKKKLHNIKYPSFYHVQFMWWLQGLWWILFIFILVYNIYVSIYLKRKTKSNSNYPTPEPISPKLKKYIEITNHILFYLYVIGILIPCIFILYMKQDYIFLSKNLHIKNKKKRYRSTTNQIVTDNIIWWNTIYILLFFILLLIQRYISSPIYKALIQQSYIASLVDNK